MQRETIKLFWRYSSRYKWRRFFALSMPVLAVLTNAFVAPFFLAEFINRLQAGSVTLADNWGLIGAFGLTVFIGEVILWRIALWATWSFETRAQRDLYVDIFQKLAGESMSFHANRFSGSLVSQTNKLTGGFERFWDTIIWSVVPVVTTISAAIVILGFLYWPYAVFIILVTIAFLAAVYFGTRFLQPHNIEEAQRSSALGGFVADMVTNALAVKSYANERNEDKLARKKADTWLSATLRVMRGVLGVTTIYGALLVVLGVGTLILAVIASEQKLIAIGTVFLILTYTLHVSRQLWETNNIMRNYYRILGDSYDMVEILNREADLSDSTNKLSVPEGAVQFDNVTFAHAENEHDAIFRDFSVSIPKGQRVGLVGHSGSGKTTFTHLLLRFMDIDQGSISIDSQDISQVSQQSLRQSIAYVPQEPLLFHRTLRENIAYGKPDANEEEIIRAAKKAHAWEFIQKLPNGLDTTVGERGVKLSGGQRQRIAIARAILKDAPILLLDEATSALDSESEKHIQAALTKLMQGRTSIVIAHRLSTIAKLDRIIVLDNGKIAEDGTHDQLIKKKGIYAQLWSHQSGGFIEE